jgi:curli biogenesis system outer membrane secretion channel CsgG
MKLFHVLGYAGIALAVAGCFKKEEAPAAAATAATPAATPVAAPVGKPNSPVAAMPDAGKLTTVPTTAVGIGPNAAAAVDEAIKMAIKQVNGVAVDMSADTFRSVLAVSAGRSTAELQAKAFSDYISQQSGGVVTSFKVVKIDEPEKGKGSFKATIEANIAKFDAPTDSKKLKIVIGPVRVNADSFKLAGAAVPSGKVASEVRQKILDALTNTGRFSVLDRDLGDDVQQEMDMISSGQAPSAERSKMSQAISADLIWTGSINAFGYQGADGNWSINQRVINVSTRQVQLSSILQGSLGAAGSGYKDSAERAKEALEAQMVSNVVSAILVRTFPITVASRDGNNVVLSQGGQSVREGARYLLVSMGQEIKDPQTGQSLGRTEYECCEVVVDKVGPTMSQGRIENIKMPLDQIQAGGLQLRELSVKPVAVAAVAASGVKKKVAAAKPRDIFKGDEGKW